MRQLALVLAIALATTVPAGAALAADAGSATTIAAVSCTGAGTIPLAAFLSGTSPLRQGVSGAAVWELQAFLRLQGYPVGPIDGRYGTLTYQAVRAFQKDHGLAVDGVAGSGTRAAVRTMTREAGFAALAADDGHVLRPGASGAEVRELQRWLKAVGRDPGTVDGKYGAKTTAAVRSFQQAHRPLVDDGKVGPATRAALAWALGLTWPGTCTS